MRLQTGSRLLFIGDSITDCGRARPIGKNGSSDALGNGYVSLISSALTSGYPDYDLEILNTGISGNTVLDLKYRWKRDVLELEPDWLSVMIGINDVWGNFSLLGTFGNTISDQVYTKTLTELIQQVRPDLQGLILMTPYYLDPNQQEPIRALMDRFGGIVKGVAKKEGAIMVDTQAHFDQAMKWINPLQLADDRVHVGLTGHMILARALLSEIGFDWSRPPGGDIGGK